MLELTALLSLPRTQHVHGTSLLKSILKCHLSVQSDAASIFWNSLSPQRGFVSHLSLPITKLHGGPTCSWPVEGLPTSPPQHSPEVIEAAGPGAFRGVSPLNPRSLARGTPSDCMETHGREGLLSNEGPGSTVLRSSASDSVCETQGCKHCCHLQQGLGGNMR